MTSGASASFGGGDESSPLLTHNHDALPPTPPTSHGDYDVENFKKLDSDGIDPEFALTTASFRTESRLILGYSIPLIGTYLLQYFYNLIVILVVSHLGTNELAAVSLGITTMNIIGFAIFEGMATSLDTLCAQAYGSGNPKLVGLHVQRMTVFLLLVAVPIGTIWLTAPYWLAAVVPQQDLPGMAGTFLKWSLVGLPGYAVFEAMKRFVQAQGEFKLPFYILLVVGPINIFMNWLFVYHLHMSIAGAALAAALTNTLRPILLLSWILIWRRDTLQCWPGLKLFSPSIFKNWGPMVKLSIPGAGMTLCEWFAFEILTFSTSFLGTADLAAQTFLSTASVLVWHIPFSASVAVSTRVGQLVGRGAVKTAKRATRTHVWISLLTGILDMTLLSLILGVIISKYFVVDEEVRAIVMGCLPVVAAFQFFDATSCFLHGTMRGLGRQAIGGGLTFMVNYAFAVPLALGLELGTALRLKGLWIGLGSGLAMLTVLESGIARWISWEKCVEEARGREETIDT